MTQRIAYTIKELATLLSPSREPEAIAKIARQLRHWTNEDLLTTVGEKHTGTGVSRRYDAEQARLAAILMELNRYHVPVPVLAESFATVVENYGQSPEWKQAVRGEGNVYLVFAYTDAFIACQLFAGSSKSSLLEAMGGGIEPKPVSAITINLSRLFHGLKV